MFLYAKDPYEAKCQFLINTDLKHFNDFKSFIKCSNNINNIISLSHHEQVCLSGLRFKRYFSHHRFFFFSVSRDTSPIIGQGSPLKHTS